MMKRRLITSHTVPSMTGQCTWWYFTPLRRKLYSSLTQKDMKELWRKFMECQAMVSWPQRRGIFKTKNNRPQKSESTQQYALLPPWKLLFLVHRPFLLSLPSYHSGISSPSSPTKNQSPIGLCKAKRKYVICS